MSSTPSSILCGADPSPNLNAAFWTVVVTLITAGFIWWRQKSRDKPSLPPGPKPVFALGNIRDITSSKELWLPATRWAKEFGAFLVHRKKMGVLPVPLGSVVYLHILGQGLVFLNTPEAVYELMERRSDIYSDKPQLVPSFEYFQRNSDP